ncbi:BglG family transcription antiterminator [Romboutsia sp.]|uniref:BglG family transcription antiterminator n=1 Tax=Romboutsia sp. TaxID=1965302 RepID=UPI003F36823B
MRESLILKELKNTCYYLSLDYFSEKLEVSTRTVRNDMKSIIGREKKHGFRIEYKSKLGYLLKIEDKEKFETYTKSLSPIQIENPEQRLDSILAILLLNDEYTTIEVLSEEFSVSRSLIKSDLNKLGLKLESTSLSLERRAHYGIKIIGSIQEKQKILARISIKSNRKIKEYYDEFIGERKIEILQNKIRHILVKNKLDINISELEEIILKLILLKIRWNLRKNKNAPEIKELNYTKESVVGEIIEEVFTDVQIFITNEEKDYLKEKLKNKTKNKSEIKNQEKSRLQEIIYNFFKSVDEEYKSKFLEDKEFFKLLYLHTASLIERAKRDQKLKNSFSHQMSYQYPTIFNLAIQLSRVLEQEYDIKISQDEIGFIATHIAVPFEKNQNKSFNQKYKIAIVCSSGGGSAYLIKLRLSEIFSNAELRNFSLLDKKQVIEFKPDLIFSIADLSFEVNAPVILIKEILDDLDYLKIKESVKFVDDFGISTNPKQYFYSLFDKNHFKCINENVEYEKILKGMAQKVVDEGACELSYPNDVWEREKFLNTIYTNGITIPHPIEMTGNKNLISVAIVKSEVEYEQRKPKILFMISLKKGNLELHKHISKYLHIVMQDEDIVNELIISKTYEEFMHKLKNSLGG